MKLKTLEPHPLAESLPEMDEKEFQELVKDIDANGMREPIVLLDGKVLDGRHRVKAMEQLGWEIDEQFITEFDPKECGDPALYAISMNIKRRHLTPGQRAGSALVLLKAAGSKQRNGNGITIEEAAHAAGTKRQRIHELKAIEERAPEVAKEIMAGKKSISKGLKEAKTKAIQKEHDKAMNRIEKVLGEEFYQEITSGGIRMAPSEVVEFAALQTEVMEQIGPVLEAGTPFTTARGLIGMECNQESKLKQLWNLARMNGGTFIYETDEFKTTVKQKTIRRSRS